MNDKQNKVSLEDLQNRVKGFNEKLIPLLAEFKLGLGATAFLTEDGRIAAKPSLFDDSLAQKVSPENVPTDSAQGSDKPEGAGKAVEDKPQVTPA